MCDIGYQLLYRYCAGDTCAIRETEEKQLPDSPKPTQKLDESDSVLRKRKGELKEEETWVEPTNNAAEDLLEQKITQMRRDPLFILNPLPSSSQRKAQSLLRKSILW